MSQIEDQSRPSAAEYPGPHHAQDKGGTAVVAESQQPLRLRPGTLAALVQVNGGPGTHGVAPDDAQSQGGGAGPVDPEQGDHHRLQQSAQIPGHAQLHHQGGQDEEGEQGGNDHVSAQAQTVPHGGHGLPGPGHQRPRGQKQPNPQEQVPVFPLADQTAHGVTSPRCKLRRRPPRKRGRTVTYICVMGSGFACPGKRIAPVEETGYNGGRK